MTRELLLGCGNSRKGYKRCTKCNRSLPNCQFNKANWIASGLRSDCKECYRNFKKGWWQRNGNGPNRERYATLKLQKAVGLRTCVSCKVVFPATEEFFSERVDWMDTSCRDCTRKRTKKWAEDNPEKTKVAAYARCATRYASKRSRTPRWLTTDHRVQMRAIYLKCRTITKASGVKHHVDHIVPLVGRTVSGLHVPWNLQILPATENMTKQRKLLSND